MILISVTYKNIFLKNSDYLFSSSFEFFTRPKYIKKRTESKLKIKA